MSYEKRTKLYILTGFLGSGKTTVLLELIKELEGHRIGIIQNEIGKLSIDGAILRNDAVQMVELNRGSIFCTCLKLNFVNALCEMGKQNFEYLFVESSGIGDPSNVEEILAAAEVAAGGKQYDFAGVICFVDAIHFLEQLEDLEAVHRQLKHCHLAVITKTDLACAEQIEGLKHKIREINPVCQIETSTMGQMDYGFLEEDLMRYQWAEGEESTNSAETKPKTLLLEPEGEIEKDKLLAFLEAVIPDVYRIKGFCQIVGEGWMQIDVVGKRVDLKSVQTEESSVMSEELKSDISEKSAVSADTLEKAQLVVISKIGPAVIRKLAAEWEEKVGTLMKLRN